MSVFGWMRAKSYIGLKRVSIRRRTICASQLLREPEKILIVLPMRQEELESVVREVKRWMQNYRRTLLISNFSSSDRNIIYCDKLAPFSEEVQSLRESLKPHKIDLLIDLNRKPQDRSRMISLISGAKLRVASFSDPPFFNCHIRIREESPFRTLEVLRILETYLG